MTGVSGVSGVRVVAHRGSSGRWPEHTRSAYAAALAEGADGLEGDVRLTADGVPVLWHDATLDRTSDGTGALADVDLATLRRLDVASWHPDWPTGRDGRGEALTVAELMALAGAAGRPVHLALELKHEAPDGWATEDALLAVLRAAGWTPQAGGPGQVEVSFMSFTPGALRHLARVVPASALMGLVDHPVDDDGAAVRSLLAAGEVAGAGPGTVFVRTHRRTVRRWVEEGRPVRVWTVADAADVALCRSLGVTELTTDHPGRVLRWLGRGPHR